MQKAPGRWPGAFLFVFEIPYQFNMRLFEPLALVEPVRLLPRSTRGNLHLNSPLLSGKCGDVLHQGISNFLRAELRFDIHFLDLRNQGRVVQQRLNMAAYHSDGLSILFGQEIGNVRACDVAVESRVEAASVEYHVFEAAYHLVNSPAVGGGSAADGYWCLQVGNWLD